MKNNLTFFTVTLALALCAGCQEKTSSPNDLNNTNPVHGLDTNLQTMSSNVDQGLNSMSNHMQGQVNNMSNQVDNSGLNRRDRDTNNLTPLDQGSSEADRMISASIRKMVVSNTNSYSMTAKNVKIITKNGKVTLRGPVKTDDEKSGIEAIAKNVAGADNVDDQLEVKNNQ